MTEKITFNPPRGLNTRRGLAVLLLLTLMLVDIFGWPHLVRLSREYQDLSPEALPSLFDLYYFATCIFDIAMKTLIVLIIWPALKASARPFCKWMLIWLLARVAYEVVCPLLIHAESGGFIKTCIFSYLPMMILGILHIVGYIHLAKIKIPYSYLFLALLIFNTLYTWMSLTALRSGINIYTSIYELIGFKQSLLYDSSPVYRNLGIRYIFTQVATIYLFYKMIHTNDLYRQDGEVVKKTYPLQITARDILAIILAFATCIGLTYIVASNAETILNL